MPLIIISHYQFTISAPYSTGTPLGFPESQILNYHRANCIRDLAARWVATSSTISPTPLLSPSDLSDLQRRITAYDSLYQLRWRQPSSSRESALQVELRRLAESHVAEEERRRGIEFPPDQLLDLVESEIASSAVQEEARQILSAKLRSTPLEAII